MGIVIVAFDPTVDGVPIDLAGRTTELVDWVAVAVVVVAVAVVVLRFDFTLYVLGRY